MHNSKRRLKAVKKKQDSTNVEPAFLNINKCITYLNVFIHNVLVIFYL